MTSTASCWITRTLERAAASTRFRSAPTPGPCTSSPRKSCCGWAAAMAAVVSPMPKPISRMTGARRPNTAAKSSGSCAYAMPNRGSSVSSARCCAGDMRPWRRTKLRTGRCAGAVPTGPATVTARGARRNAAIGVGQPVLDGSRLVGTLRRVFDDDRVVALPLHRHVTPLRIRLPAQFLADSVARDEPHRDFVVAVRGAEIRDGHVLAVRRQRGFRRHRGHLTRRPLQRRVADAVHVGREQHDDVDRAPVVPKRPCLGAVQRIDVDEFARARGIQQHLQRATIANGEIGQSLQLVRLDQASAMCRSIGLPAQFRDARGRDRCRMRRGPSGKRDHRLPDAKQRTHLQAMSPDVGELGLPA